MKLWHCAYDGQIVGAVSFTEQGAKDKLMSWLAHNNIRPSYVVISKGNDDFGYWLNRMQGVLL